MALDCLTESCKGRITTGRPGKQKYWEGDEYMCPKCGAEYVIGVTDDYEDDAIAFLKPKQKAPAPR
jgi:hypothetical protein